MFEPENKDKDMTGSRIATLAKSRLHAAILAGLACGIITVPAAADDIPAYLVPTATGLIPGEILPLDSLFTINPGTATSAVIRIETSSNVTVSGAQFENYIPDPYYVANIFGMAPAYPGAGPWTDVNITFPLATLVGRADIHGNIGSGFADGTSEADPFHYTLGLVAGLSQEAKGILGSFGRFLVGSLIPGLAASAICSVAPEACAEILNAATGLGVGLAVISQTDPVDTNYKTLATPATPPALTLPTFTGETPNQSAALAGLTQTLADASVLPDVITTSYNRAQGALAASDFTWVANQLSNMDNYFNLLQTDMNSLEIDAADAGLTGGTSPPPSVPEPASALIFATALVCLGIVDRCRASRCRPAV